MPPITSAVLALDLACGDRLDQTLVGALAAPTTISPVVSFVQAVHDAGARQLNQRRIVKQQRVLQRTVRVAGGGCTTSPAGLLITRTCSSSKTMFNGISCGTQAT